jgi:hypothetical protein
MTILSGISKETFFLDTLVPTGLVAELLLAQLITKHDKDENAALGHVVWEPLNLVSHYVLSPKATTKELPALRVAVLAHQAVLLKMLEKQAPSKRPFARRTSVDLDKALKTSAASIEQLTGLADFKIQWGKTHKEAQGYREAWVKEHTNPLLPSMASISKWRTFSRNLEPQKMARELDLGLTLVTEAKQLSSHSGAEGARKLWQSCFSLEASGAKRKAHKPLPENVTVEVFPSGVFEIVATFQPRVRLGIKPDVTKLAPELAVRLSTQQVRLECGYDGVGTTVKKAIAWQQKQEEGLAQLKADFEATLEQSKSDAIYEKFNSTFSAEEIAVLRKRMATA